MIPELVKKFTEAENIFLLALPAIKYLWQN